MIMILIQVFCGFLEVSCGVVRCEIVGESVAGFLAGSSGDQVFA
jgi:hypothetical protein